MEIDSSQLQAGPRASERRATLKSKGQQMPAYKDITAEQNGVMNQADLILPATSKAKSKSKTSSKSKPGANQTPAAAKTKNPAPRGGAATVDKRKRNASAITDQPSKPQKRARQTPPAPATETAQIPQKTYLDGNIGADSDRSSKDHAPPSPPSSPLSSAPSDLNLDEQAIHTMDLGDSIEDVDLNAGNKASPTPENADASMEQAGTASARHPNSTSAQAVPLLVNEEESERQGSHGVIKVATTSIIQSVPAALELSSCDENIPEARLDTLEIRSSAVVDTPSKAMMSQLPTPPSSATSQKVITEQLCVSNEDTVDTPSFMMAPQDSVETVTTSPAETVSSSTQESPEESKASNGRKQPPPGKRKPKLPQTLDQKSPKSTPKKQITTTDAGVSKARKFTPSTKTAAGSKKPGKMDAAKVPITKSINAAKSKTTVQKQSVKSKAGSANRKSNSRRKSSTIILTIPVMTPPDPEVLALSNQLTARMPLDEKPVPAGQPLVWAESRQALCETLPYFKKPQGGCYSNDEHVYGFLFDSVGHCREYLDDNVIICRAGGSMEQDGKGPMVQKQDHKMTQAQVKGVKNDMAYHNPLIVICGDRNGGALCKMPHKYCILGWYKPALVWSEKTAGKGDKVWTTIKYRLERLNRRDPAWHAPIGHQVTEEDRSKAGDLAWDVCSKCSERYPQIYLRGWMCLNGSCTRFWKLHGLDAPYGKDGLEYNPAFLLEELALWKGEDDEREPEPASLRPPEPNVGNVIGDNLAYVNTRGVCCPQCGRCSSRRFFKGWVCENVDCTYSKLPEHRPVAPAMLYTPWDMAPTLVRNKHDDIVNLKVEHWRGYKVSTYTFHGVNGRFVHLAASKEHVSESYGPTEMFAEMQVKDMGLERRRFAVSRISGNKPETIKQENSSIKTSEEASIEVADSQTAEGGLNGSESEEAVGPEYVDRIEETTPLALVKQTQHAAAVTQSQTYDREPEITQSQTKSERFLGDQTKKPEFEDGDLMTAFSMNYGMPYKFVASGASRRFAGAPWPVMKARDRMNSTARDLMGPPEDGKDFNELLIFAYLEGQKIEYHDDGEDGLGPRIATLSLGGRAKMHMRMKHKHYVGCSKTGTFTEEKPVPGSIDGKEMYQKRLAAWEDLQKLKGETSAYNKRRKEIPRELDIYEKRGKQAADLVTVTLSHGDIIFMEGYDIQKYLEHKVVPEGYLRFALTCRTVLEDHLKPEELAAYLQEEESGQVDAQQADEETS